MSYEQTPAVTYTMDNAAPSGSQAHPNGEPGNGYGDGYSLEDSGNGRGDNVEGYSRDLWDQSLWYCEMDNMEPT